MENFNPVQKHKIVLEPKHLIMSLSTTIIFNMYHDSLLAGHQGPYHTEMTIRQKFFIHNLMNKVKGYLEACHTCLKTKLKDMKN